jgi:hypothetical protein
MTCFSVNAAKNQISQGKEPRRSVYLTKLADRGNKSTAHPCPPHHTLKLTNTSNRTILLPDIVPSHRLHTMSVNQGAGSVTGRSFHDYQLILDDEEPAGGRNSPLDLEQLTSPATQRRQVYNASSDVYFDEDTTLPSREEPSQSHLEALSYSPLRPVDNSNTRQRVPLGRKNYLNVLVYLLHLFVSWGIGIWGLGGILKTRWAITTYYETLVTPAPWAYVSWFRTYVAENNCSFRILLLLVCYANYPTDIVLAVFPLWTGSIFGHPF